MLISKLQKVGSKLGCLFFLFVWFFFVCLFVCLFVFFFFPRDELGNSQGIGEKLINYAKRKHENSFNLGYIANIDDDFA